MNCVVCPHENGSSPALWKRCAAHSALVCTAQYSRAHRTAPSCAPHSTLVRTAQRSRAHRTALSCAPHSALVRTLLTVFVVSLTLHRTRLRSDRVPLGFAQGEACQVPQRAHRTIRNKGVRLRRHHSPNPPTHNTITPTLLLLTL
jgi:hypothetical protein